MTLWLWMADKFIHFAKDQAVIWSKCGQNLLKIWTNFTWKVLKQQENFTFSLTTAHFSKNINFTVIFPLFMSTQNFPLKTPPLTQLPSPRHQPSHRLQPTLFPLICYLKMEKSFPFLPFFSAFKYSRVLWTLRFALRPICRSLCRGSKFTLFVRGGVRARRRRDFNGILLLVRYSSLFCFHCALFVCPLPPRQGSGKDVFKELNLNFSFLFSSALAVTYRSPPSPKRCRFFCFFFVVPRSFAFWCKLSIIVLFCIKCNLNNWMGGENGGDNEQHGSW